MFIVLFLGSYIVWVTSSYLFLNLIHQLDNGYLKKIKNKPLYLVSSKINLVSESSLFKNVHLIPSTQKSVGIRQTYIRNRQMTIC